LDYNYNVYQNIRKTLFDYLETAKPKLVNKFKKDFPSFTFSQLMIPERRIEPGFIEIKGNFLAIFVSSVDDTFMEYVVQSIIRKRSFHIFQYRFPLKKVDVLEEPEFKPEMRFKMLSPMLLVKIENKKPRFVQPEDGDLADVFSAQLVGGYNYHYQGNFKASDIHFFPDQDYMERKPNLTKVITIKNVHYKTIFLPFTLQGNEELIRFAYYNGVGASTEYGFGMIDIVE
jgi:CRISPR-associated endoribonuclease Cas6